MSQFDTLTIFSCGTSSTSTRLEEAVAYTYSITLGRKWINEGPGILRDKNPKKDLSILQSENIMKKIDDPKYIKHLSGRDIHGQKSKGKRSLFANKIDVYAKYQHDKEKNPGSLFGKGTADNVINTIQWLWLEYWNTQIDAQTAGRAPSLPFSTINLVGWSRGAVTSIMIAHAIEEAGFAQLIPNLRVNIFAFDPVPGAANDFDTTTWYGKSKSFDKTGRAGSPHTLPHIVKDYTAVLMENLEGGWFYRSLFKNVSQPSMAKNSQANIGQTQGTTIAEFPFPGSHGDAVLFTKTDNPSGHICLHLCHEFLMRHGTELEKKKTRLLNKNKLLEEYAEIRIKYADPSDSSTKVSPTSYRKGIVFNWMRENNFFINMHHFDLFKEVLPETWEAISSEKTLEEFQLKRLEVRYPKTYEALTMSNHIEDLTAATA